MLNYKGLSRNDFTVLGGRRGNSFNSKVTLSDPGEGGCKPCNINPKWRHLWAAGQANLSFVGKTLPTPVGADKCKPAIRLVGVKLYYTMTTIYWLGLSITWQEGYLFACVTLFVNGIHTISLIASCFVSNLYHF